MHHAKNSTSTTAVILLGLTITAFALPSDNANDVFATAAVGVGLALLVATAIELSAGVRRLLRVDILMLWALYGLTLLEFLFPQPDVEVFITPLAAVSGTKAVLLGFASLSVGRHLVPGRSQSFQRLSSVRLRANDLFLLFVLATFVGYLHILVSVNFDLLEMLRQMSLPRFWQSWGRGKYGDLYSLLYECGMLINLIPPVSGLIFARIKEFRQYQKIVIVLVLALTVYYAFASGTRNVLVTYFLTFGGAYFLAKPKLTLGQVLGFGIPMLVVLSIATMAMLEFRGEGLSNFSLESRHYDTLFIDANIVNISQLTQVFPNSFEFLGWEIPFNALIRPIPRALWPSKPEALSTSIEDALGASAGTTLSCTFVGEAYMAGGLLAVVIAGLFFGVAAEAWNRVGRDVGSPFAQLLYASGFLCAAIAMRSMLSVVPLTLPVLALWLYGRFWLQRLARPPRAPLTSR